MKILCGRITSNRAAQNGFSLVEAMVAIAIFSIGILGAYTMQYRSAHSNLMAHTVSTSTRWATYQIEELLGKFYDDDDLNDDDNDGFAGLDDLGADADGVIYVKPNGTEDGISLGNELYTLSWNIAEGEDGKTDVLQNVKQIRVHVVKNGGVGSRPGGKPLYSHNYFKVDELEE
mgnify:CR=1 FL=1